MKKSAGIAAGVIVVAGAVSTVGAWYTGKQLKDVLDQSLVEANEQLATASLGSGVNVTVELDSLEQRLFGSTARYRLKVDGQLGEKPMENTEFTIVDEMEHGPFPLSRLKRFQLMPVMVASQFRLEENPLLSEWFAAAQGQAPLYGEIALGYNQDVDGTLSLRPLDFKPDENSHLTFSGMDLNIQAQDKGSVVKISGTADTLSFQGMPAHGGAINMKMQGLTLDSQQAKGESGLFTGTEQYGIKRIEFQAEGQPVFALNDITQRGSSSETNQRVSARAVGEIASLTLGDKVLGSSEMVLSVDNLDATAIQPLTELYTTVLTRAEAADELQAPGLSDEEKSQLMELIGTMLAAKPSLALEKLSFKTANGESSFSLKLDLTKPESFEQSPDALAKQIIAQLDAKLQVSKPMIRDIAALVAQLKDGADPAQAEMQAEMMAEMAGGLAEASGMATLEGDDIRSSLHYANDEVDFNGKKMAPEEFGMLIVASAMGMGGAAAQPPADFEMPEEALDADPGQE